MREMFNTLLPQVVAIRTLSPKEPLRCHDSARFSPLAAEPEKVEPAEDIIHISSEDIFLRTEKLFGANLASTFQ